jgi:hypothetical protein
MTEGQPGPPGSSNHDNQPVDRPTEPLGGSGQPAGAPVGGPGQPTAPPPALPVAGPPREALAGFWRRLAAAFLDWILIGVVAAAIGELFGVDVPAPPSGDGVYF